MCLGQVIKAWDIGVATMKLGELCQLICKPEYAYGSAGSPPKIPPNATLVFEVTLIGFRLVLHLTHQCEMTDINVHICILIGGVVRFPRRGHN